MTIAQMVIGSWNRTHGAGKNLASKLAAACAEFGVAESFEAFYHKYSDTSLWYVSCTTGRQGRHFQKFAEENLRKISHLGKILRKKANSENVLGKYP